MKQAKKKKPKKSYKFFWIIMLLILLILASGAFLLLGPATKFAEKSRTVYINQFETNKSEVILAFEQAGILRFPFLLGLAGAPINLWDHLSPGKYQIRKGQSIIQIVRMLKNGRFGEVNLVINKLRTKQDFAKLISNTFPLDSAEVLNFMSNDDSLKAFQTSAELVYTKIIQNTYSFYYNASLQTILTKLIHESNAFWLKNDRMKKAQALGMTPQQVYILASIVDEETNYESDKYKIASVYINRLKKQMPLQACPTIKFAMNDFTITRIYEKYLNNPSPYNTYQVKGLPPGPICTPLPKTIDIVLDAPATDYLFFVAKSDFSGYHHFSNNYAEHNKYADEYQKALDAYMLQKEQQKK